MDDHDPDRRPGAAACRDEQDRPAPRHGEAREGEAPEPTRPTVGTEDSHGPKRYVPL